ncbi:MAG: hypothetical protein AAF360_12400 [Pseudomonadota bacterium]
MTLASTSSFSPAPTRAPAPRDWMAREPLFAGATLIYLLACLPVIFALLVDPRQYQDVSVWLKPLKFLLSVSTFLGMLVWAAQWLPAGVQDRLWYRVWSALIVACATAELVWIICAAAFGVGSHFNVGTPLMSAAYTAAGVGAVTLLTGAPVYGALIWRNAATGLDQTVRLSLISGLILTFPLTFVAAGYLGGAGSHFVGGDMSDADGMILTGWARDGGDLRVAHFFAMHAMHFIPVFGLIAARIAPTPPARGAVWAFAAGYAALTVFTFAQALAGRPFLPMIP